MNPKCLKRTPVSISDQREQILAKIPTSCILKRKEGRLTSYVAQDASLYLNRRWGYYCLSLIASVRIISPKMEWFKPSNRSKSGVKIYESSSQ